MWRTKLKEAWRGALFGAVLTAAMGAGLLKVASPLRALLLHQSYNVLFQHRPAIPPGEAVLIYMDEDSHRELQQPYDRPWDREVHARLLDRLTADGARAVIYDIIFSGPNSEHAAGDDHFARAIQANGRVVLGAEYKPNADGLPSMYPAYYPFSSAAAAIGFVELTPDEDFTVRRSLHVPPPQAGATENDADSYSSLTWEAARIVGAPAAQDPRQRSQARWLNYYGPPGTIPSVSFWQAMDTNTIPPGTFHNKVVIVGGSLQTAYSGEHKDEFFTPYSKDRMEPAVDVQATQCLNLLRGDWLTRLAPRTETGLILGAGLLAGFVLVLFRPLLATLLALLGAGLVWLAALYAFQTHRVWFPWLLIVALQIPVALLWSVIFNSIQLYVQNQLFKATLGLYLSPKLVRKFSGNRDLLKPGAKKETLTIVFSDIADFSSLAEGLDSDELAHHMNAYFQSAVADCIHVTDGTIVKYIGDAIFAFWNAPDPQPDHDRRACEAALRFRDQPPLYIRGRQVITRIGIHTGVANVGNFGSTARVDYTALGENVNLASRLEGLNKHLGTEVLLSAETCAGVTGQFQTRWLGNFRLKGFERLVGVYELLGRADSAAKPSPAHAAFATALDLFQKKNPAAAEAAFREVQKLAPNDGPTRFYLKYLAQFRTQPPPADWSGEVELQEK